MLLQNLQIPEVKNLDKKNSISSSSFQNVILHRDLKIVSVIERCPLYRVSSQIGLFCFKNLL